MRRFTAWACVLIAPALSLAVLLNTPAGGQGADEVATAFYDRAQMLALEQSLTLEQQASLIMLRSRYVSADPALPVPSTDPTQPFLVKFRVPMRREFASRIKAAGGAFIGYASYHTHFVRARDADVLQAVRDLLVANPDVAGTALSVTQDRMTKQAWQKLEQREAVGDYRIQFWADVTPGQAAALLASVGAEVVQADYRDGMPDMDTRYLDVRLAIAALQVVADSPLIEMIDVAWPIAHDNVASATLVQALPTDVGPGTAYNLTGEGMIAGVWDSGRARDTHVGFQGAYAGGPFDVGTRRILTGIEMANNPDFAYVGLTSDTAGIASHSTHCMGTVLGNGASEPLGTGFAPRAYGISLSNSSMDSERRIIRHHFRHVADSHSYGAQGGSSGGYASQAATSDTDIRDLLLKMTRSAGNEANGGVGDDNTIGDDTCNKNGFIIGAADDTGVIANFSSRGPSDDGRLMPHFMLNGVTLLSTESSGDTVYGNKSGTSMSTPSACGSLVLLSELYSRENNSREFLPDVAKAVLAATTTDVYNPGPDFRYGFGIPSIKRAADLILADKASGGRNLVRGTVRQGTSMEYELQVTGPEPLRVICCWLDIYATTQAAVTLVNDIDLELIEPDGATVHYPYSGIAATLGDQTYQFTNTGPNRRDNCEYAEIANPATGTWTVRVTGFNIPVLPQAAVLNDATGFVLACERPFTLLQERVEDLLNAAGPVPIPDDDLTGESRTFTVVEPRPVAGVRLLLDIKHPERGQLDIYLTHPDGTTANIEASDTSTRRDIIGIFPDTRQYDDDVAMFLGKPAAGVWTLRVTDNASGAVGSIRYLMLEVDIDTINPPVASAGLSKAVQTKTLVTLDASQSSDPDGDALTFAWAQLTGPVVVLSDAASATPSFTAPKVSEKAVLEFELTVDDGNGGQDSDVVTITVVPPAKRQTGSGGGCALEDGLPWPAAVVLLMGTALIAARRRRAGRS
jgi:subtilisin-like proprotein convertase family protein